MKALALGSALWLAALNVHVFVARPAEREAARLQDESIRLRNEKRGLSALRLRLERERGRPDRRANDRAEGASASSSDAAVAGLRRAILDLLAGRPVTGVQLSVTPGSPPVAALGRVRAEGSFADLVDLSGRLVRPGTGMVLRRAQFATLSGGVLALEVEGFRLAEGSP